MNETKKVSRRKYTAEFKAKVALEAMQENQTLPELCSKYQLSPNQVNQWKKRLRERSAEAFRADASGRGDKDRLIEQLYKTIGELTMDVEFLKKKAVSMSVGQRCGMVSKEERLSIRRQCVLLGLYRSVKQEYVYENPCRIFDFYNNRRLHQSLGYQCPAAVYTKKRVA